MRHLTAVLILLFAGCTSRHHDVSGELVFDQRETSAELAIQEFTNQEMILKSMYASRPHAYPGFFTQKKTCPEDFKPKFFSEDGPGHWLKFFILKASPRRSFGVCSDAEAGFLVTYFFLYCRSNSRLLTGRIFYPLNSDQELLNREAQTLKNFCSGKS